MILDRLCDSMLAASIGRSVLMWTFEGRVLYDRSHLRYSN